VLAAASSVRSTGAQWTWSKGNAVSAGRPGDADDLVFSGGDQPAQQG
jgi:hypothetical protein